MKLFKMLLVGFILSNGISFAQVSDEFNETTLNPMWRFVNPLGDCSYNLTGEELQLNVASGATHDLYKGTTDAVRMLQTIANEDFYFEVKFNNKPSGASTFQGVVVQQDHDTFIRFDIVALNDSPFIIVVGIDGESIIDNNNTTLDDYPQYFRVQRVGDDWTFKYSFDGSDWVIFDTRTQAMNITEIGLTTGNAHDNPAYTGKADYFRKVEGTTTIMLEAENYDYNENPHVWRVLEDPEASGGKVLANITGAAKTKEAVGWKIETTSLTDTIYYVWYYGNLTLNTIEAPYMRHYVNLDGDTTTNGSTWPFEYFNNIASQEEDVAGDPAMYWYQNHAGGGEHDSIVIQPGGHMFYLRQRDVARFNFDKIKITNDLTWKPEVTYEWEAENWPIVEPLEKVAEIGASGDAVVATKAGSGMIGSVDILRGNLDVGIRNGRVSNDDVYLWMLVNLPSEDANSYWIGMGDEGIIPPSWEGAVTSGYEWRQLTDESGVVKSLHVITNDFNKFHTLRIKQQEEGTKIDKYLITNNPDYVPTIVGVEEEPNSGNIPMDFSVSQNYPNPFNPSTMINYTIPKVSNVTLSVYNTLGQKVAELVNEEQSAGNYIVNFNASNLSSGIYFYTVKADNFVSTKKMILIK